MCASRALCTATVQHYDRGRDDIAGQMLRPFDVIAGAQVRDCPKFYVLGCFDSRITFYSQQVRALSLVHALHELGFFKDAPRIAVIGAGAAGLTAAAAAALASEGQVVLYESSQILLPLQFGTNRRKLDPHIYDWPQFDTTHTVANLPILDWEAGPARDVRKNVANQFEDIAIRMDGRLEKRTRHLVHQIRKIDGTYEVEYECLDGVPTDGVQRNPTSRFDMIFLAVGFGLEPQETIQGIPDHSYWSDRGVPAAEFAARPRPRFFISGNGDGGLIDLVASASRDFDHAAMIRLITEHAGIDAIATTLLAIDSRARKAESDGEHFDIFAAYDAEILAPIEAIGLLGEVVGRLRPGIQLTFQTRSAEIFTLNTSVLNRLAVFATIKACEASQHSSFTHIHCENLTRVQEIPPAAGQSTYLLAYDGAQVEVDEVVIRRGPNRYDVRRRFLDMLGDYEVTHAEWLKLHGKATLVPTLSKDARAFFDEQAALANIPLPRHRQAAVNHPVTLQLRAVATHIRWSGALAIENIADPWQLDQLYHVILLSEPDKLGVVSGAILRMVFHARHVIMHADAAHWLDFARRLSSGSLHARGMNMPRIGDGNPGGASQNLEEILVDRLARKLHRTLDLWMLERVHQHLDAFLRTGSDPGNSIGLLVAPNLREMMADTWNVWHEAFEDEPAMLNRFLRLMVCAIDDDDDLDAAQVLVGPKKLAAIIRGTVVSLAVASSWQATVPKNIRPGNLRRELIDTTEWTGHSCAADMINGKAMPLCAGSFMWQTNFVILAESGNIELAQGAETSFAQIDSGQSAFTEIDGAGPVLMSISKAFSDAVEAGPGALQTMLADIESQHFTRLMKAIEKAEEHV